MEKGFCADIPFSRAAEQKDQLVAIGLKAGDIYIDGFGAEDFESLLGAFNMRRDKTKRLSVWGTIRVLGDSRKLITSRIKALHAAGVIVFDRQAKLRSDRDGVEMLDAAQAKIQGSAKVKNDRKYAQKLAAKGGKGKLESMRSQRMPEEIAGPIWRAPELTAERRLELMNPPIFELQWTEGTAYRHLGNQS